MDKRQGLTRRAAGGLPSRVVGTTSEKRDGDAGHALRSEFRAAHEWQASQRPRRDRIAIAPFRDSRPPESCSAIPHAVFGDSSHRLLEWRGGEGWTTNWFQRGVFGGTGARGRRHISLCTGTHTHTVSLSLSLCTGVQCLLGRLPTTPDTIRVGPLSFCPSFPSAWPACPPPLFLRPVCPPPPLMDYIHRSGVARRQRQLTPWRTDLVQ